MFLLPSTIFTKLSKNFPAKFLAVESINLEASWAIFPPIEEEIRSKHSERNGSGQVNSNKEE